MRDKDQILLEQAYLSVLENVGSLSEEEANKFTLGFNMELPETKEKYFERLKQNTPMGLIGKEVALSRAVGQKQSSGYFRDKESKTVPGSGGSVAHTQFELIDDVFARGIVQDIKVSKGDDNLILTISGRDKPINLNQGTSIRIKFLEDSPAEVHDAGRRSFYNQ